MALLESSETTLDPVTQPQAVLLGRGVVLLMWDVPQTVQAPTPLSAAEGKSIMPTASLRLARCDGGTRLLWALRCPDGGPLNLTLSTGSLGLKANLSLQPDATLPEINSADLTEHLDPQARVMLASILLNLWSGLFHLQRDKLFVQLLFDLLERLPSTPLLARVVARAVGGIVLLQTTPAAEFGKIDAIYRVTRDDVGRLEGIPHRSALKDKSEIMHLLTPGRELSGRDAYIVLTGPEGLQIRSLVKPGKQPPPLTKWFRERAKRAAGLREHLLIELSRYAPFGVAAALETQLNAPLEPQRVGSPLSSSLSAEITCALPTPSGMLVAGWLRDPLNLTAGIAAIDADGSIHDLTSALRRYPVHLGGEDSRRVNAMGFVALSPSPSGDAPILQPRFRLLLKSGAYHSLTPPVQPADPAEARAAALRAVPAHHVDETMLAEILAPVITDLHAKASAITGQPLIRQIGEPAVRPKVSIIVPLYKVLDFMRFQIAAFATDPWFREHAELIYVLDSPDQATEVDHLLVGLHMVYGLPVTLAIMNRNGGYARACNTGVTIARGRALALVNSDVIPLAPGWISSLVAKLDSRKRVGAVGPKLLFEDGSLQHAGMYFARDHRGRWLNHHYFKGMPRHYAPAKEERVVPAVTGACLIMARDLFEKVGGFSEDYVIGDYEDSDLCLKIATAGRKILYAPNIELYHLERKSMSLNSEYMKGIAWQYNCALHGSRWGDMIANLMKGHAYPPKMRSAA
ncbi:glycosyltransferase [Microvirga terricola]|uniref:Glycosyltransferase family 2 protein n=1 Tax=Microvirga terricola TaxID=2719797 RepID=A0ABX0VGG1_9HYPH|nr:glycosyltransferase family 2 protein [Microvirga terricola]NIX78349.1 glycosyltransferase family 2 protein [Microvirga terricola]